MSPLLFIFSLLFASHLCANTVVEEGSIPFDQNIQVKVQELSQLKPNEFEKEILNLGDQILNLFANKRRYCKGEFSTAIFDKKLESIKPRRLDRKERKECFQKTKELQVQYVESLYQTRRRYLEWLHQKNLEQLDRSREISLKDLDKVFK